jgi:hypothetical protein
VSILPSVPADSSVLAEPQPLSDFSPSSVDAGALGRLAGLVHALSSRFEGLEEHSGIEETICSEILTTIPDGKLRMK